MPFDAQTPSQSIVAEYNILLLGESLSGKSLFINSLAKYIYLHELSDDLMSESTQRNVIIPTTVVVPDQNYEGQEIHFGNDKDSSSSGQSASTSCRTYIFNFGIFVLRLIDTPGFGQSDSTSDDETFECILKSISKYDFMVNGVAIVTKSNQLKLNRNLERVARIFLDQLDNVLFLLCHSGVTKYKPGDVMQALKELLSCVPNAELSKENMFCFDNKGFQHMLLKQSGYGDDDAEFEESCRDAWKRSAEECYRLIQHLINSQNRNNLMSSWVQHQLDLKEADTLRYLCNSVLEKNRNTFTDNEKQLAALKNVMDNSELAKISSTSERQSHTMARYVCTSTKCKSVQKADDNTYTAVYNQICGSGFSWRNYCKSCGCKGEEHKKIDNSESKGERSTKTNYADISQEQWHTNNQLIRKIKSEQKELKTIREIFQKLDGNPHLKRALLTKRTTTLGQMTGDNTGSSREDYGQSVYSATMTIIMELKQQLFNLKKYGRSIKYHFEKSTVEPAAETYDILVDITRLENRLLKVIASSNTFKSDPLDQVNRLTDSQKADSPPISSQHNNSQMTDSQQNIN